MMKNDLDELITQATGGGGPPDVPPGQEDKTDEEILEEVADEMPSEKEFEEFTREVFLQFLSTGLTPEHFKREPTGVTRETLDRLWRHSLQVAVTWSEHYTDPKKAHNRVTHQKFRGKKQFKQKGPKKTNK
jgi:hypothetical protein